MQGDTLERSKSIKMASELKSARVYLLQAAHSGPFTAPKIRFTVHVP